MIRNSMLFLFFISLLFSSCRSSDGVQFKQGEDRIDVSIDGKLVTSYRYSADLLKPCLYPVYSLSGVLMTRSFPFKEIKGETHDHKHHTGVFFAYASDGEVNGSGFWSSKEMPPQIRHSKVVEMKAGKESGTLSTVSLWIGKGGKPLLRENRTMVFIPGRNEYSIDFTITLTAIDTMVSFKATKEGLFAVRVADWLTEKNKGTLWKGTGEYMNAEGAKTEKNIWGRRSKWVRLQGEKDGRKEGIAIFNHPTSENYPTFWMARGYGLFAANPLGQNYYEKYLKVPNPKDYELKILPGKSALFKFRMLVYDGARSQTELEKKYLEYSHNSSESRK
ncbi:MAG: hypothetical protein GWP06_16240 [Actinobacteria bacterium]|nr:hypothetical protein [Actinomycetota bacterium]